MRRIFIIATMALISAAMGSGTVLAAGTQHYGPIPSTSPDSGTCGNDWANDTFERHFTVNPNKPNVVEEQFKNGSFVTVAGASPGACQNGNNGKTVGAGVQGKTHGEFTIVVTGGTYNPNATCTNVTCGTTAGFIATVYGPTANYDIPTFLVHYSAGRNGEWKNASADRGGNQGDITGNP